jgi:GTP-binding protein HflX
VGFIRDLPKDLVAAFRATFEEAADADLLLHVVDASDPHYDEHIECTEKLLGELELAEIPRLVVFNKSDAAPPGVAAGLARAFSGVSVSAMRPETLKSLAKRIEHQLFECPRRVREPKADPPPWAMKTG